MYTHILQRCDAFFVKNAAAYCRGLRPDRRGKIVSVRFVYCETETYHYRLKDRKNQKWMQDLSQIISKSFKMFQNTFNKFANVANKLGMFRHISKKSTKLAQNISKSFKMFQNTSKYLRIFQNISECFDIFQNIRRRGGAEWGWNEDLQKRSRRRRKKPTK